MPPAPTPSPPRWPDKLAAFNCAATRAAAQTDAPASFKVAFIDELYRATPADIAENPLVIEGA